MDKHLRLNKFKLALFLLLGMAGMTKSYAETIGNLNYSLNRTTLTATVTGHVDGTNATGSLIIPSSVTYTDYEYQNGHYVPVTRTYTVTTIGNYAFENCTGLSLLTIPNSVTTIGNNAFYQCTGFSGSLTIPNSVITVGEYAFGGCDGFTGSLIIGNSVTTIGKNAFYQCTGFSGSLTIPNSVTTIGVSAFSNCGFTGSLVIPNSVTHIGGGAFDGCSGFTGSLVIPNSVTSIGNYAFYGCSGFTGSLVIPNSVTSIGSSAFYGCSGFTGSLVIPNSVTHIGMFAFSNCSSFETVYYNATNLENDGSTGLWSMFDGCGGTLTIGNDVEIIYGFMFCDGAFTGSLTIPNSVIEIGENAFWNCSGFTGSLTIGNSVTMIDDEAFYGCSGFTGTLTIGESLHSLEGLTNSFCHQFNHIIVASGNTQFDSRNNCDAIIETSTNTLLIGCNNTTIPNSVTTIGNYAFENCTGLSLLTIPNSVTTIGDYAFGNCSGLTEVYYNAANAIYNSSSSWSCIFENCNNILLFVIGEDVESLPNNRLFSYNCPLQFIKSKAVEPPTVGGNNTFSYINKNTPVIVPCGALEAYQAAPYWSEFTNIREGEHGLAVKANPNYLGTAIILQEPDCNSSHASVMATPMPGCRFINWTCNGEEVSQDRHYSFDMEEDMVLTANFVAQKRFVGTFSLFWLDSDNWEPAGVPIDTMSVDIQSDVVIDTDVTVRSMFLHGNYVMTIMPGATLTVTEHLVSPSTSNIVIEDGGQLLHPNDDVYATVKKTAKAHNDTIDNWNLIACPLLADRWGWGYYIWGDILSNDYDLYYYDEPTHYWNNYKQTDNNFYYLDAGKGYLYANSGTMETTQNGIQIGEGTGTTNTFYTYCNYISECLFRANELATAGLGTEPLGAFCWYATDSYASEQSNISIWMANVSDNELTENSHITNGMTLVYTGNMNPSSGWNEFVFNESSFTWDGTSNVLICVQRNNGEWNWDDVTWQCHGTDFAAMSYDYSYDNAYDMTSQTYYMSTNYYRPNIVFEIVGQLGQSVYYYPITLSFAGNLQNGSETVNIPLSYTNGIALAGLNLVGNPFACNAYLLDENNEAMPFYRMNDAGDAIIAAQAGTPIKPCEGVFVFCPDDRQAHSAVFTTTAPANIGEAQDVPNVLLPIHDLLINQDACGASSSITQSVELSAGANWFSTNVEVTLDDLKAALAAASSGTTITIKSQNSGQTTWNGRLWVGTLRTMDVSQMYMISVANACEITLEGLPIDPAEHPVTISNGPNWIGFPLGATMTITNAFANFASPGDIVKSDGGGQATWNGRIWTGQLKNLEPGKGYIYQSAAAGSRTFTFPTGAK